MEGTTWESLHIISNYNLKNILLIIDRNNSDFRSIKFLDIKKRLAVFCDKISEVNGHDIKSLNFNRQALKNKNKFEIIIEKQLKEKVLKP